MPSLSRRALLASAAATVGAQRPAPPPARAPELSTAPHRQSAPVPGDVWLRDGQAWAYTASGWVRRTPEGAAAQT